jgi:hypothetical protein
MSICSALKMLKPHLKKRPQAHDVTLLFPINGTGSLVFNGNGEGAITTSADLEEEQNILIRSNANGKKWFAVVSKKVGKIPGKSVNYPIKEIKRV